MVCGRMSLCFIQCKGIACSCLNRMILHGVFKGSDNCKNWRNENLESFHKLHTCSFFFWRQENEMVAWCHQLIHLFWSNQLEYNTSAVREIWILPLVDSGGFHLFSLFVNALSVFCNIPDQGGTCIIVIRNITGLTWHSGGLLHYVLVQTCTCFVLCYFQYFKELSRIAYNLNGLLDHFICERCF